MQVVPPYASGFGKPITWEVIKRPGPEARKACSGVDAAARFDEYSATTVAACSHDRVTVSRYARLATARLRVDAAGSLLYRCAYAGAGCFSNLCAELATGVPSVAVGRRGRSCSHPDRRLAPADCTQRRVEHSRLSQCVQASRWSDREQIGRASW